MTNNNYMYRPNPDAYRLGKYRQAAYSNETLITMGSIAMIALSLLMAYLNAIT